MGQRENVGQAQLLRFSLGADGKFAGLVIPALAKRGATDRGLVKDEIEG
jgi:hypothetical protein